MFGATASADSVIVAPGASQTVPVTIYSTGPVDLRLFAGAYDPSVTVTSATDQVKNGDVVSLHVTTTSTAASGSTVTVVLSLNASDYETYDFFEVKVQ
jgi:hypothetical protein